MSDLTHFEWGAKFNYIDQAQMYMNKMSTKYEFQDAKSNCHTY
jgi:hypothetical protein